MWYISQYRHKIPLWTLWIVLTILQNSLSCASVHGTSVLTTVPPFSEWPCQHRSCRNHICNWWRQGSQRQVWIFGLWLWCCEYIFTNTVPISAALELLSFDCDAVSICILLTRNIPIKSCSCMGNYWVLLCYLANMVLPILLQIVFWPMLLLVLDDAWEYKMWIFPVFVDLLSCTYLFALFRGIYLPALLHLEMTPVSSFVFFNAFVFVIL